jgi:thioredoxin-like negative regulator of GroEL
VVATTGNAGTDSGFSDEVTLLTEARFNSLIKHGANELWVVNFFAPWCSHCNRFKVAWNAAAEVFAKPRASQSLAVNFGAVNCEQQPELCDQLEINFYPQVKSFYTPQDDTADALQSVTMLEGDFAVSARRST